MSFFTREILKDYGSACAKIGDFLSLRNSSTSQEILKGTNLETLDIQLGLSVLLQRRIASYVIYDKATYYKIDRDMIIRRLYFNVYTRYVMDRFQPHRAFLKILVSGISKISSCKENVTVLVQQGILKEISRKDIKYGSENGDSSKRRDVKMFYVVDFEVLDKLLLDVYVMEYLKGRYSNSMKEIYKSVCKSTLIDSNTVLSNLESTKILIKDGISYMNDTANIGEYLKYLCNLGVIRKDFDGESFYKKKTERCLDLIKIREMCTIIQDTGAKRLLNMFYDLGTLADSEVAKKALLPSAQIKHSMLILHKYGCINLEYPSEGGKHPSVWRFNSQEFPKAIAKVIEKMASETLLAINDAWETGNIFENEAFLIDISRLHFLSEKYFLLCMKF